MRPEADQILNFCAGQWLGELAPQLAADYARSTASLNAMLTIFAAQEYEHGAEIRARENKELRTLLARHAPSAGDTTLTQALSDAAAERDQTLTISALNAANNTLKSLLIRLQCALETQASPEAQAAAKQIWESLAAMAERRMLRIPPTG